MKRRLILALIGAGLFARVTGLQAEVPATLPAGDTPAVGLLQNKSAMAGYGAEVARQVNEKGEIVTTLRNGLTVIIKRVPSKVVTVRCHVRTGSVYEGKWLGGGLSHLLEHLVAGGSTEGRTEAENRNLLQRLGNNSNAYTTFDSTSFFVNTTTDHMEEAVDLVTGWVFGSLITETEYRREYEVVQRELEMGKGDPETVFADLTNATRYRVHPARVPIIGYQEVIQGLTRDDVYSYYKQAYQPQNMVLAVVGDLEPAVMLSAVQKHVAAIKPGREFLRNIPAEPAVVSPRTTVASFPKLGHAELQLAFPTVRLDHPDLYALDLLAAVLGDGYGALLIETLRDDRQLVTDVKVWDDTPDYAEGTFAITATLQPDKIKQVTEAVLEVLEEIKRKGVDADRLRRAKVQMKVARFRGMQTTDEISTAMVGDYIATGDPHFRERYIEQIQKVTNAQIRDVAKRYLDRNKLLTTALLPAEGADPSLPKAEDLLRPMTPASQTAAEAVSDPQATRIVLPNGAVLLTKRLAASPVVSIQMFALGGVSVESADNNGIGNLAMSMIQRGTGEQNKTDVAAIFDSIGGELSTSCTRNYWNWSATCLGEDFEKAFTAWAEMINKPSFDPAELRGMKERIAGDIAGQDANWEDQALHFFRQKFYQSQSPYRFAPEGSTDNLKAFTVDQVKQYYWDTVMKAPRVIAIYGDIEPAKARQLATQWLGTGDKLPETKKLVPRKVDPPADHRPQVDVLRVEVQKTEQSLAGVVLGYESNSQYNSPANPALTVGDAMASGYGYPTGYLFETLRGKGLVYTAYAQDLPGRSDELPGTFVAAAGCDAGKVNDVVDLMLLNIARLQGTPADLQQDWFERSKQMIIVGQAMEVETADHQALQAATDELFGLGFDDHNQFADRIKAVKLDDVREVARDRLRACVVTISTPNPELVKVKPGVRVYDAFPSVDLTPTGVKHDSKTAQP